ncbi:MAG TPA: hypothetical protein VLU25_12345 [Acidobacteriota bacterium]|nr:hypothetical protein [Acidobacteriota bacterium]
MAKKGNPDPAQENSRGSLYRFYVRWRGPALLVLAVLWGALIYYRYLLEPAWSAGTLSGLQALLGGLVLLAALLYVLPSALSPASGVAAKAKKERDKSQSGTAPGYAFPQANTVGIGLFLVLISLAFVAGLFVVMARHEPLLASLNLTQGSGQLQAQRLQLQDAMIAMLAAGIGSCISTLLAYLKHASSLRDFDPAYTPWYLCRPLMGVMLGLVFYFLLKGGFLATVNASGDADVGDFNDWGLAGISALVGLFTKNAVEKLGEVFQTLFRSRDQDGD